MLDVITRRGDLELTLQIGAEILVSEDPRNRGDHPELDKTAKYKASWLKSNKIHSIRSGCYLINIGF